MKKFEEYSRKDVLNVFKPTCKLEIDEMKAQNILKKVYEEYKISEERYEVAEKVLKEGFEIIERKRKKTFGKWIPKFLWELLV